MGALFSSLFGSKPLEIKVVDKNQQGVVNPLQQNRNKNKQFSPETPAKEETHNGRNYRDGMFPIIQGQSALSIQDRASLTAELTTKQNELKALQSQPTTNSLTNSKVTELETRIQSIKKDLGIAGGRSRKIKFKLKRKRKAKSLRR